VSTDTIGHIFFEDIINSERQYVEQILRPFSEEETSKEGRYAFFQQGHPRTLEGKYWVTEPLTVV
jgi:hypothetical protein